MKDMDDIFDKLNESLLPTIKQLEELQRELGLQIQRRIKEKLSNARTIEELEQIKDEDEVWFEEWPQLLVYYQSASDRIKNVFKVYKDLMGLEMLN